jgi:hypothetical protein
MKLVLVLLALVANVSSAVEISGSDYAGRHVRAIDRAIINNCGYFWDYVLVSSEAEVTQVDQGIRDVKYFSVISAVRRIDQGIWDNYKITVVSGYADMYDHAEKDWGVYTVKSVRCELVE